METVVIRYVNGSQSVHKFKSYFDAHAFCQSGISYSGGRVKRVEVFGQGQGTYPRAIWDASWTDESKRAGLRMSR